ncbi:hypothetical protein NHQ30_010818 [Ciborinia camelliae]|nr:hypothetical protein NHQ30_010818 [Ciborinia camelliae]
MRKYPKSAWNPTPSPLIPNMPLSSQVLDRLLLKNPPRAFAQLLGTGEIAAGVHPSGKTTKVWGEFVETKTLTSWDGFPTLNATEDQAPSSPS